MSLLLGLSASSFFRDSVFEAHKPELWLSDLGTRAAEVCQRWGIDSARRDTVLIALLLLHRLLLSDAAVDEPPSPLLVHYAYLDERARFRRGGRRLKGPPGLEQTPDRFFAKLLSPDPEPPFSDPELGLRFYAYGWCSELEMAYVNALRWFGIPGRVVFVGPIHVNTAVKVDGREFLVDNSFGGFFEELWTYREPWSPYSEAEEMPLDTVKKWARWYNRRAKTRAWDSPVPAEARRRVLRALRCIIE